tara:strand:+ start:1031 stop:1303 length:273 start_codon:yes stop_codon:yes gene_type:complete
MQSDIVEELEAWSDSDGEYGYHARSQCLAKAATEIAALRERVAKLEDAIDNALLHNGSKASLAVLRRRRHEQLFGISEQLSNSPPATDGV